jgi:hypothetical protein
MRSSRPFALVGAVTVVAFGAVAAACSGAELSVLDEAPGASSAPPDGSALTTTPDSSGSQPTPSHDAGASEDASVAHDGAPLPPPPALGDSGSNGEDAGTGQDSAPPSATGIPCGKTTCDPGSKVCCVTWDNNGDQSFSCDGANDCDINGGLSVPCASAADCVSAGSPAGSVCCVSEGNNPQSTPTVACVSAAACLDPGTQAWMCDPTDPACPPGDTCRASTQTIPPYSICVAP